MSNTDRNRMKNGSDEDRHESRIIKSDPDKKVAISSPSEWLERYNKMLDLYPLRTKMITSFCVSGFGSALGSYFSASAKESKAVAFDRSNRRTGKSKSGANIDWVDVLSYAIHGGLINAPISHYWFEWLSVNGPSSNTTSVLVDQLAVQPPLLVLMFVCLDVLRANIRATLDQFREANVVSNSVTNALRVVPNSWRFWPLVLSLDLISHELCYQFAVYFTFKYLKKKHYTVALNLCSVAWTVYLSRRGDSSGDGNSN
ncbi:hypothetical protein ACHAWF_012254 [Thalassiosira exigua]